MIRKFTIEDLVKKPDFDYVNFMGENRVFKIFNVISPLMRKLKEGEMFGYQNEIYLIVIKLKWTVSLTTSKNIQFNCIKIGNSIA